MGGSSICFMKEHAYSLTYFVVSNGQFLIFLHSLILVHLYFFSSVVQRNKESATLPFGGCLFS